MRRSAFASGLALAGCLFGAAFAAERKYDPGASDTEIRIGQTMPYSGPASAYGIIGRVHAAFFLRMPTLASGLLTSRCLA